MVSSTSLAEVSAQGGPEAGQRWLDEFLNETGIAQPASGARYPFSFKYGGKPSAEILKTWKAERRAEKLDANREQVTTTWTDPATGLRVRWAATRYADFP